VHSAHPFYIIAWVVLPDHIHTVWRLPEEDSGYAMRWGLIKAGFSRQIAKTGDRGPSRREKGERGTWQRRFWEHMIRDERDLNTHIDYIHFNPVKHGLVNQARDWPYSTFHRYVARGDLDLDWGCTDGASHGFGEPSP
jgi:putative transposase